MVLRVLVASVDFLWVCCSSLNMSFQCIPKLSMLCECHVLCFAFSVYHSMHGTLPHTLLLGPMSAAKRCDAHLTTSC